MYTSKKNTTTPTVALADLIITCVIGAFEQQDMATLDIPGAFLHTNMPEDEEDVHVILEG